MKFHVASTTVQYAKIKVRILWSLTLTGLNLHDSESQYQQRLS